jgi:DNA topoisomerase IB/2'-5' RNA ligase
MAISVRDRAAALATPPDDGPFVIGDVDAPGLWPRNGFVQDTNEQDDDSDQEHTGAMIALIPSEADLERLAVPGGEPKEELHCTLAYLGEAVGFDDYTRDQLITTMQDMARDMPELMADGFAINFFNPKGENPCVVLGLSGDQLRIVHDETWARIQANSQNITENHSPWIPHITLIYTQDHQVATELHDKTGSVVFNQIRVAFGGDITDIPLGLNSQEMNDRMARSAPRTSLTRDSSIKSLQTKVRHVRTRAGAEKYNEPIGAPIVAHPGMPSGGHDHTDIPAGPHMGVQGAKYAGMHPATEDEKKAFKERFKKAVPPAWTDVHIADDLDNAKLLLRGRDAKGRPQSLYSAAHTQGQAEKKFTRIQQLMPHLEKMDHAISQDAPHNDHAAALMLIRRMGMRPGSERDTGAEKHAHGATNLRAGHVKIDGGIVHFNFIGKEGKNLSFSVHDPEMADVLAPRLEGKGPNDRLFDTNEDKTRAYMKSTGVPQGFLLKDLRTVRANVIALREIAKQGGTLPKNKTEFQRMRKMVATAVSNELGNTPTMALSSYINPTVFTPWILDESWV